MKVYAYIQCLIMNKESGDQLLMSIMQLIESARSIWRSLYNLGGLGTLV